MKLTENQERQHIARRILPTFISLLFLSTAAATRPVHLSGNTGEFDGATSYEHIRSRL